MGASPAETSRVDAPPLPSILLASPGTAFDRPVIDRAVAMARNPRSFVHVVSIARVWGTALGIQHPGLLPTKREWQQQLEIVGDAVRLLKRAGLDSRGGVIGTRNPSKVIAHEAARLQCSAIVIGWRPLSWWMTYLLQDEVWWVQRRAKVPVVHVELEARK
jgi:nucleotide-binding universal stress UspA family protein